MLVAVLLTVVAPDHVFGQDGHRGEGPSHEVHNQHCHGDAASCSDAPVTAGATVLHLAEGIIAEGGSMVRRDLVPTPAAPSSATWETLDPPPRDL